MRLDRYQEFLLESDGKMKIFYSDAFRSLLTYMATGSKAKEPAGEIARRLLHSENREEYLDSYTLIDKTGKNDMISYVQTSRFYREHPDLKDDLPKMNRHNTTIAASKFWNSGRTPEYGIGRWARRVYKDVLKEPVKDSEIEAFVNYYKSTYDEVYKGSESFELVKGQDISKWYHVDRYEEENGQLGNSCMRYKRCQPYLDIYVQNPDVCQLLILKSEKDPEKIIGRALVWTLHDGPGVAGRKFMDRIYTIKDSDRLRFLEYAKKNELLTSASPAYKIQLKPDKEYSYYPYMDTFYSYDKRTGILSQDLSSSGSIELRNTDGTSSDDEGRVWSEFHGEYIDDEDARWCSDIDGYAHYEDTIWLEYIDEYVTTNADTVFSEWDERSYYSDDTVHSECMDDSLWKEIDLIRFQTNEEGNTDWCPEEADRYYIEVDGKYYSRKDYVKDPYTGEYGWKGEALENSLIEEFGDLDKNSVGEMLKQELIKADLGKDAKEYLERKYPSRNVPAWPYAVPALFAYISLDIPNMSRYGSDDRVELFQLECADILKSQHFREEGFLNSDIATWYAGQEGWRGARVMRSLMSSVEGFDISLLPEKAYKLALYRDIRKKK